MSKSKSASQYLMSQMIEHLLKKSWLSEALTLTHESLSIVKSIWTRITIYISKRLLRKRSLDNDWTREHMKLWIRRMTLQSMSWKSVRESRSLILQQHFVSESRNRVRVVITFVTTLSRYEEKVTWASEQRSQKWRESVSSNLNELMQRWIIKLRCCLRNWISVVKIMNIQTSKRSWSMMISKICHD